MCAIKRRPGLFDKIRDAGTRVISKDHRELPWWLSGPHYILKLVTFSSGKFWRDNGFARSATLAYSTILALVPIIAIFLLVLASMPGQAAGSKTFLFKIFIPASGQGIEKYLDDLATNLSTSVTKLFESNPTTISFLTVFGLILTVVFLLNTIEESLNDVWRAVRSRSWINKLRNSWMIMTLGPALIFLSYFLTVKLTPKPGTESPEKETFFIAVFLQLLPYILSILFFFFIYALIPFTRVRLFTALVAAIVAGALWNITKEGFNAYVTHSVYYLDVFGKVAILPLFLIWIYASWIITLIGAELAFCHQNFAIIDTQGPDALATSAMSREYVAVRAVLEICRAHERGKPPVTLDRLSRKIKVSELLLTEIIEALLKEKILHTVGEKEGAYFPSRPSSQIRLVDVVVPARSDALLVPPNTGLPGDALLANIFNKARVAATHPLHKTTFADLLGKTKADVAVTDEQESNPPETTSEPETFGKKKTPEKQSKES